MSDLARTLYRPGMVETPEFSAVERMFLPVLADVRDRIVRPIIMNWEDAVLVADDTRTAHRMAAALLFPVDPLRGAIQNERSRLVAAVQRNEWTQPERAFLRNLLNEHGHLLFNSYCYTTVSAFGDYHLVPLLLGYRPDDPDTSTRAARHIARQELPFHLNDAYISTYEQLLSCSAGITPFGLRLFAARQGGPTENVANFLGDLAILYKREDYVQGHLAALIAFLGPGGKEPIRLSECAGAFVVTSVVPGAFDENHEGILGEITQRAWDVGFVRSEPQPSSIYARGVAVSVISPAGDHPLEQEFRSFMRGLLSRQVRRSLVVGRIDVSAAGEPSAVATGVNLEAVERFMRAQIPTGPHYTTFPRAQEDALHVVDPASLARAVASLQDELGDEAILDAWRRVELDGENGFLEALRCLVPETLDKPCADIRLLRLNMHARVLVVKVPTQRNDSDAALEALRESCAEAAAAARLPDGENTAFAAASDLWRLPPSKRALAASRTSHIARDIATALESVFDDDSIRAVCVVADAVIFQANADTLPPAFAQAYLSYPSYWLFERLNRLLMGNLPSLEAFRNAGVVMAELIPNDRFPRGPRESVPVSDASDPLTATLLTFLGIATERTGTGASPREWDAARIRDKLWQELHDIADHQSIQRAFKPWKRHLQVEGIRVKADSGGETLTHTLSVRYADRTEEAVTVPWSPTQVPALESVWLNRPALLRAWASPVPSPPNTIEEDVQGIPITTTFVGYPVPLEQEPLGRLAAGVARMHLARQYAEADASRQAAATLLRSFLHDLKTPLVNSRTRIELIIKTITKIDGLLQLFVEGGPCASEPCFEATRRLRALLTEVPNDLHDVEESIALVLALLDETAAEFQVRARLLAQNLEWFRCRTVAERARHLHGLAARNKELTLSVESEPMLVFADPHAIASIFRNLLSNAINFTARGGVVRVRVIATARDEWRIVVENGPLAVEGDIKRGSGIGLQVVRDMLSLHKGELQEYDRDNSRVYEAVIRKGQRSDTC